MIITEAKKEFIKQTINQKITQWIFSIKDTELQKNISENCIVTGGAIASLILDQMPNDWDVYFTNEQTRDRVRDYYQDRWDRYSEGELKWQEVQGSYGSIYMTPNAITLLDDVQLILRFFGTPKEIHKNFDFLHCTTYWMGKTNQLVLPQEAVRCIKEKKLKYIGSTFPLSSMMRTKKFIQRGFSCNSKEYLKIALQLSTIDLLNENTLIEQLEGAYNPYFSQLIKLIRAQDKQLTTEKIIELVEKIHT